MSLSSSSSYLSVKSLRFFCILMFIEILVLISWISASENFNKEYTRFTIGCRCRPKNWSLRFYLAWSPWKTPLAKKMGKNISIHHVGFYCFQLNKKCDLFLLSKFATFKIVKRCGSMIQILKHFLKVDIVAYTWITFLFQLQNRFFFLFLLGSWSFFCRVK